MEDDSNDKKADFGVYFFVEVVCVKVAVVAQLGPKAYGNVYPWARHVKVHFAVNKRRTVGSSKVVSVRVYLQGHGNQKDKQCI